MALKGFQNITNPAGTPATLQPQMHYTTSEAILYLNSEAEVPKYSQVVPNKNPLSDQPATPHADIVAIHEAFLEDFCNGIRFFIPERFLSSTKVGQGQY